MNTKALLVAATLAITALTGCKTADQAAASSVPAGVKPYPLQVCLVMDGDKVDKDSFSFVHQGQEIKLCCEGCKEDFDKEPAKYLNKLAGK